MISPGDLVGCMTRDGRDRSIGLVIACEKGDSPHDGPYLHRALILHNEVMTTFEPSECWKLYPLVKDDL